jgi:hypothetical protein
VQVEHARTEPPHLRGRAGRIRNARADGDRLTAEFVPCPCPHCGLRWRWQELLGYPASGLPETMAAAGACRDCGWHHPIPHGGFTWEFRRGFVAAVRCSAADWLSAADAIRAAHPVTRVVLTDWPGEGWPRIKTQPWGLGCDRWPGVTFEPPPEVRGRTVPLPPDWLTRDYTAEGLAAMEEAGRRRAVEEEREALGAVFGPDAGLIRPPGT